MLEKITKPLTALQQGLVYLATNAATFTLAHKMADSSENIGYWLTSAAVGWGLGYAINSKIKYNPKVMAAALGVAGISTGIVNHEYQNEQASAEEVLIHTPVEQSAPILGKKVAVVGASNTVNGKYVMELGKMFPESTFDIFAEVSAKPSRQRDALMPKALAYKPDSIILCPSGNGVGQSGYIPRVKELIEQAGEIPTILLTVSPRKEQGSVYRFKDAAQELGADLVVDITTPLQNGKSCGYCTSDGYHWSPEGHRVVAKTIRDTINKEWGPKYQNFLTEVASE